MSSVISNSTSLTKEDETHLFEQMAHSDYSLLRSHTDSTVVLISYLQNNYGEKKGSCFIAADNDGVPLTLPANATKEEQANFFSDITKALNYPFYSLVADYRGMMPRPFSLSATIVYPKKEELPAQQITLRGPSSFDEHKTYATQDDNKNYLNVKTLSNALAIMYAQTLASNFVTAPRDPENRKTEKNEASKGFVPKLALDLA